MYKLQKTIQEPLLHFLLIGAGLFLLFSFMNDPAGGKQNRIVVSPGQVEQLAANFARTWMRVPTEDELSGLIKEYVRDEVYYREALAMGLDQNDPLIRRRMRRKLEFIFEDLSSQGTLSDEQLSAYLHRRQNEFRMETRISFRQIFLNPDKRRNLDADAAQILVQLRAGVKPETLGDPTLGGYMFHAVSQSEIARSFGEAFAQEIVVVTPGDWTGPLYSGLGGHLVLVTDRQEGRMPGLTEVRPQLEREYLAQRRRELKDRAFSKLLEGYEVIIEPAGTEATASEAMAAAPPGRAIR
jgi:hypothetical protein